MKHQRMLWNDLVKTTDSLTAVTLILVNHEFSLLNVLFECHCRCLDSSANTVEPVKMTSTSSKESD